ncbi:MAG: hypothetical protein R3B90_14890 [Planctomycetaceae bacterium]
MILELKDLRSAGYMGEGQDGSSHWVEDSAVRTEELKSLVR